MGYLEGYLAWTPASIRVKWLAGRVALGLGALPQPTPSSLSRARVPVATAPIGCSI